MSFDYDIFQIILMLIGFGSILFLAYVTTRFISGKSAVSMRSKHISIADTITLGMDKKLCLVKAGEEYVLIAVCGKRIDFLCNVNISEADTTNQTEKKSVFDFKSILEKYSDKNNIKNKGSDESLENGIRGSFRTNLNKLKSIAGRFNDKVKKDGD